VFELARPGRSTNPLITSLLLHSLAALALFTLHFTGGLTAIAERVQHVSLLSPFVAPMPLPAPSQPPPVRTAVRPPRRVFQTFPPPPPSIALESVPAIRPVPSTLSAPPALPQPPRIVPDLQLVATAPAPAPKVVIRAAGFSTAELSTPGPPRGAITATGAFDTAATSERGPAHSGKTAGNRASGFGDSASPPALAPARRAIENGGFGDATVAAAPPLASAKPTGLAAFTAVEILYKPRPRYSEEGRRLQIEGEVLVEMLFGASGQTRVLRVIRGLGHGLDENAIAAAGEIRFRPALRGGAPVDYAATVHIVFQLAY
jgi:TonB family protein